MQRSRRVSAAARMMVKDTESGVEFPLGQRFWWVLQLMHMPIGSHMEALSPYC